MEGTWQDQHMHSPQQHPLEAVPPGPPCKTECPSPPNGSRPDSPAGPSGPEAIPSTYHAISVADGEQADGLTVIRQLNPEEEGHHPEDRELIYQNLSGFPTSLVSSYGLTGVPTYATSSCNSVQYANKLVQYEMSNGTVQSAVLHQGYESPTSHTMVPSSSPVGCSSLHYGSPVPYPQMSHSPVQSTSQPMWSVLGGLNSPYCLSSDLGNPGTVDGTDMNRGYMYGGATYLPSASAPTNDALWTTYDKNQALPPMPNATYLQDSRRTVYDSQEFLKITEPIIHQCAMCGTTESSPWRRETTGQFVCNACGVYKNGTRTVSGSLRPQKRLSTSRRVGMTCSNCKTNDTTLWRRNGEGQPVCNACGLYYKLHQVNRPISMRKDSIQTRKRKPKSNGMSRNRGSGGATNGTSKCKTPASQSSLPAELPGYLPQGTTDGAVHQQHLSPSPHRSLSSPVLPSSAALSQQQMQHLTPLDPPTAGPYLLTHGLDPHDTVINMGHK